ncbi:MAG: TIGR02757 family protein [Planctomycetes bacterium]|nr:TIGR02757 family protein [Planctomycetota bacterium]
MTMQNDQLKVLLEQLYQRLNRRRFIEPDPLGFVYRYSDRGDMEIAGFIASQLAYGRVRQIEKSVNELLGYMGKSPSDYVRNFRPAKRTELNNFRHRFTGGEDISALLELLRDAIDESDSLEEFFAKGYSADDKNIAPALSRFSDSLLDRYTSKHGRPIPRGLGYLLCRPSGGSACKRLNLFLRWMVRDDDVDTGLWKSIDKAKLIIPMDVHISRIGRKLGLYGQKNISLKAAVELTESFAKIEPADPVKYDFALCRSGMLGNSGDLEGLEGLQAKNNG